MSYKDGNLLFKPKEATDLGKFDIKITLSDELVSEVYWLYSITVINQPPKMNG